MTGYDEHDGSRRSLDDELRAALGGAQEGFDYAGLVAGTKVRATRLRRRRAVAQGVTAAVLVPTLVGAGWMVGTGLDRTGDQVPSVAGPAVTTGPTGDDVVGTTDPTGTKDPASTTDPTATGTEDPASTTGTTDAPEASGPPYQDPAELPQPEGGLETNPAFPNAWEVPDARPTGVRFLDGLGVPRLAMAYPRTIPLQTFLEGGRGGVEPHSGMTWSFHDGTDDLEQPTVTIIITGWDESEAAMAALRAGDASTDAAWVGGVVPEPSPWPGDSAADSDGTSDADSTGEEGGADQGGGDAAQTADRLLVASTDLPWPIAGALVRQGGYLVGVTVQAETLEEATEVAAEIADKSAANLAHLDPDHARD